ncbi:NAD-P-binding protein [Mollisia scopiformis]|uniref:NAD-P-binding protein n=1 Tax=Mollisia scopiformis TaxID=149040 RepID=A0A194WZ65_MOLSC|nr:NAD-P-binding protein [Mollisia scopiformis]KUJ12999.1 NAD-P-binding protein [Mollisia scopiformis]
MASNPIVLVTGINGFIGSHIVDQFLAAGYKVRGTVRAVPKADNIKRVLSEKHGEGRIEVVAVPDLAAPGAFDDAVKGVDAIAHCATIINFSRNPKEVIPDAIAAVTSILHSALREPTVKSFVLASSSMATTLPKPNVRFAVDSDTWNEEDIARAWDPELVNEDHHDWTVYAASKAEAEKALWKFRDEKKPHFTVNSILPATNFGPVLVKEEASSSGACVKEIWNGEINKVLGVRPQYYVSVQDVALLHVAAVHFPDVNGKRVLAGTKPYNWNDVLKILRELRPGHDFPEDVEGLGHDLSTVANGEAEKLLLRFAGYGWIELRELMEQNLSSLGY